MNSFTLLVSFKFSVLRPFKYQQLSRSFKNSFEYPSNDGLLRILLNQKISLSVLSKTPVNETIRLQELLSIKRDSFIEFVSH